MWLLTAVSATCSRRTALGSSGSRKRPRVASAAHAVGACRALSGVGLVGLPNVGKSTLFNALVRAQLANASNYPFCTINPQSAAALVPDPRLLALAAVNTSARVTQHAIDIVDIAGLIAGASKGEGLGNAFLANVRETSAILQVVRCFDGAADGEDEIIHVLSHPDPCRDIDVIENELVLADLQSIEKRLSGKQARTPEAAALASLLGAARALLEDGLPARLLEATLSPAERPLWPRLQLLTQKPMMYVCNVGEADARAGRNGMTDAVRAQVHERAMGLAGRRGVSPAAAAAAAASLDASVAVVCAKLESEVAVLTDAERAEYLAMYGMDQSGMDGVLRALARLLRQHVFYTSGPTETRAWSIPVGASAVEAAACIHSDIARGFIKAETTSYEDYVACGGEDGARRAAKTRAEGKDYVVQDGDVVHFRHNG